MKTSWFSALGLGALSLTAGWWSQQEDRVLVESMHHLGDDPTPDWPEAPEQPEGTSMEWRFTGSKNLEERALWIRHRHVDNRWSLKLNGREIAVLKRGAELQRVLYPLPAGSLVDGENRLSLSADQKSDDITVGEIVLTAASFRSLKQIETVRIQVLEEGAGAIPARLTLLDPEGKRVPIYYPQESLAVRDGVVYTGDGQAEFGLSRGRYQVFATRGTEWSVASTDLEVAPEATNACNLVLKREIDTRGWMAADTHIHTLTYSGHGDSSVEERVVTLAGEGVELAIATDHNHHTDYKPIQAALGVNAYFTAVTGNEVTTDNGHFNAFPLPPDGPLPDYKEKHWPTLVEDMRAKGAKVVILNHPRWPKHDTGPLGVFQLNRASGERHEGPAFTFDAMEIFNSTTPEGDLETLLRDWFAILNYGEQIAVVGSSDSHTVLDPVGQGRTYVPIQGENPAAIDVDEACRAFQQGAVSASLGIFASATLNGHGMGSLVAAGQPMRLQVRVASASWIQATRLTVYRNGEAILDQPLAFVEGVASDQSFEWVIDPPPADAWLTCVVRGPDLDQPFWYDLCHQSGAVCNPFYLDRDGDGQYRSPRQQAQQLIDELGTQPEALAAALAQRDPAVAVQTASLLRPLYLQEMRDKLRRLAPRPEAESGPLEAFLLDSPEGAGTGSK
ncbi:MAG: hypothetical protein DWQ01_19145 [Planctomycetota bacterium]|nr:MAG: hypothetical protein DWQ01_19145 [Planctomycetota bacterium]